MLAHVLTVSDPFHPASSRELAALHGRGPLSACAPAAPGGRPYLMLHNGAPVLRADWPATVVDDGDLVTVVYLPQGGRGGSNPLAVVLQIALFAFAPGVGQALAWSIAETTAISVAAHTAIAAVTTAAVTMAGAALINAVLPPKGLAPAQAASLAAPSPTYDLQAQGNAARLDAAIPVQYGRLCAYPDLAAQPYAEYAGNEQYLYQLLCLGLGEYEIEAVRIEDTPVSAVAEIEMQVLPPGSGANTLFPANVVTAGEVSGQELIGTRDATYVQSGATLTVSLTTHGLSVGRSVYLAVTSGGATAGAYTVATVPGPDAFTVTAPTATTSGAVTVHGYLGPYTASAPGTGATTLGIDLICPRGLYHAGTDGTLGDVSLTVVVEARALDDLGAPAGAWAVLGTETLTDRTTTPQRRSYRYAVAAGRYEVRCRRSDAKQTDAAYGHEVLWGGLRAYLPDTRSYGPVTLLAVRMRASNNLSVQASRRINVICTRKVPVWTGSAWTAPQATRSIAWALADAARSTVYGGRLPDARLDLAGLLALDALWTARGDHFDGRFDRSVTLWEALTQIAQAGRARPYQQGGLLRVARDGPASVPVALFSMRSIRRGSLTVEYLLPTDATADAVEVAYFDERTWSSRRVVCTLAGSTAERPAKVTLFGVTDRAHAWREGLYQAASNRYRRRLIRFSAEMEGLALSPGDLIAIQHDLPGWGQHAEVVEWAAATRTLTLSEPLVWTLGATHYVGLRTRAGGVDGPYRATPGAAADQVVLDAPPLATPGTGGDYERTHVAFGAGETWRQPARVVAVRPRGLYEVDIEAVGEDPSVHTADQGLVAPAVQYSQLTTRYTVPVVADLTLRSSPGAADKALLSWTAAPGAESYQIEMAPGTDPYLAGVGWTRVGETTATHYAVTALYGAQTLLRVRAVGLTAGPWVSLAFGHSADYMWTADATALWSAAPTTLMWRY